jgi:hypothetical protein
VFVETGMQAKTPQQKKQFSFAGSHDTTQRELVSSF